MSSCSKCGASVVSKPDAFEFNITTGPRTLARISQLLATNEPPQEAELVVLRPVAQQTAARLACLDAEISRLHGQLRQLEEERATLAEYHAQNTTIFSPSRRIPSEILGEIFLWSLPSPCSLNVADSPWVLTHVCRLWRAVAVSKSSLWTRIHLNFANGKKYSLNIARTQIERARTLKVGFYGSHDHDSGPQVDMLQLLVERSSMWQELHLGLIAALVPPMSACAGRLPQLQRVRVQRDGQKSQAGIESVDFLRMAASLVEISVSNKTRFIPTPFPTSNRLTRYELDAPWTTHYELLKSLPNLRDVRIIRNFDRGVPWPAPGEFIHLMYLRYMYISRAECLDYIIAPALESVVLQHHRSGQIFSHLESFIARSSCVLRRLVISGLPETQPTEEILKHCPSVTELALRIGDFKTKDQDVERNVLCAFLTRFKFAISDSATPFLRLSKLDFSCQYADAIPYPLYLDMLDSWCNTRGCALKSSELLLPKAFIHPDSQSLARMSTLREAGLQIRSLSGETAQARVNQWIHVAGWR
ncbi:F-box domain-containing protein [Mycena sanguinolenta]|uniref:F-box domain-containing protein n=1 Tax=Mycena sanguinolenta TaxID=230812 RepID=A0A8H6XNM8_9AGAR|nr:F-box domain-containing protein [Mycena sanguinolenta]